MAKKGQEIEELYVSLGLNIDDLKLGFDTAGKTVSQAISKINTENRKIQVKTDVDLSKLEGMGSELDKIQLKYEAINRQLDLQRQKESILQAQLKRAAKDHGEDHGITQKAQLNLLYQQKNVVALENQLKSLAGEMGRLTPKAKGAFSSIEAGAERAKGAVGKLGGSYSFLSAKMAAFLAVASTGAGLFNLTNAAMNAGQATYRLTQRLHVSAAEAGQLKRVFTLAGSDLNSITPFIARLDKQLMTAGENGNNTTKSLEKFGIVLTNEKGQLLSVTDQLAQLAKGYETAQQAGEEEAFTAEVLGAKGAALIPVLQDYNDLLAISKSIKTTGLLDPKEAHETWLEWQKMQMEIGQLKSAMGAALLPISKEIMPDVVDLLQKMVQLIKDNKEEIVLLGQAVVDSMRVAKDLVGGVAGALDALGINAKNIRDVMQDIKTMNQAGMGHSLFNSALVGAGTGAVAGSFFPGPGTTVGAVVGAGLGLFGGYKMLKASDAFKKQQESDKSAEAARKKEEAREKAAEDNSGRAAKLLAEQKNAAEEAAKANDELRESLYVLTHSDLENSLHAVDMQMKKFRERGASEVEIVRVTEAQKGKILKQFNEEVARTIDSIWKSEFQNRLDAIEREKEAWKQKGLDEVKATEWAEERKRQLQQDTALHMFKENYKYLKIYRTAMAGYGSEEEKRSAAMSRMIAQLRKDAKLPDDAWTTPAEIAGFNDIYKKAQQNIIPIYDKMPEYFIWKGTDAVPMFPPGYNESMQNLSSGMEQVASSGKIQEINYNLNVNISGLDDVENKVAQTAAKKILERMPNSRKYNVSYGG